MSSSCLCRAINIAIVIVYNKYSKKVRFPILFQRLHVFLFIGTQIIKSDSLARRVPLECELSVTLVEKTLVKKSP